MFKYSVICLFIFSLSQCALHGQSINIETYAVGDIVDEKYSDFGLGIWDRDDQMAYRVKHIEKMGNYDLICFIRTIPCTPIVCPEELEFFLIEDRAIINRMSLTFGREDSPKLEVLHNTFIQYLEIKHNWFEDEKGNMDYDESEEELAGIRLVLKNDSLHKLEDLSKADLRLFRNLIFAKYGYQFKSEDLNTYFNAQDWYRPNPGVDINSKLSEQDKDLIAYIRSLESDSD